VFCGLHGVIVLSGLGGPGWRWAGVGLVLVLGLAGLGGRGPAWMVPLRAGAILVVGVALQGSAGGAGGWFAVWPFVLVAVYPLALPGPAEVVVAGLAVLGYVLVARLAGRPAAPLWPWPAGPCWPGWPVWPASPPAPMPAWPTWPSRPSWSWAGASGWGGPCWTPSPTPTSVLDAQGRIVAANHAWVRFAATDLAGLALAEVGQGYPAACQAAAAAGYDGLEPAANGVRAVLAGEASLFRCRYQAPDGTRPYGAVVTHRPPP
jgi:hypothetical protein